MAEEYDDCCNRTWRNTRLHCRRAVTWRITKVKVTDSEVEKLLPTNETAESKRPRIQDGTLQKYMVWRRSSLIVSSIPVLFSAIMSFAEARGELFEYPYNGLGKLLNALVLFDNCMLFVGVVLALWFWRWPEKTMTWLARFWAMSVVLPLIPALFPVDYIVTKDFKDFYQGTAEYYALEIGYAIQYAVFLLPIVITFPAGAWRGALRIRGLFASSSLAGWILQLSAPFYSIFVLMALVVIMQLSGNFLLLIGTVMLTISPWIAVARRHLYLMDPTTESDKQLDRTQRIIMINNVIAYTLIIIWALAEGIIGNDEETAWVTYEGGIRLLFEMIGRVLVTTLIFTDRLVQMTVIDWKISKQRRERDGMMEADCMFSSIEQSLPDFFQTKKKTKEKGTEQGDDGSKVHNSQPKRVSVLDVSATARTEEADDVEVGIGAVNQRSDQLGMYQHGTSDGMEETKSKEIGSPGTTANKTFSNNLNVSFPVTYSQQPGHLMLTDETFLFQGSNDDVHQEWFWGSVTKITANKVKDSTSLPKLRVEFSAEDSSSNNLSAMFTFESRESMEEAKLAMKHSMRQTGILSA